MLPFSVQAMLEALILGYLLEQLGLLQRLLADDPHALPNVRAVLGSPPIHVPLLADDVEDLPGPLSEGDRRDVSDCPGGGRRQRVLVVASPRDHPADEPPGAASDADLDELLRGDNVGQERQERVHQPTTLSRLSSALPIRLLRKTPSRAAM